MKKNHKKSVSVLLSVLMLPALAMAAGTVHVVAFRVYSGHGYYPETYISSPDGQLTPDLESLYAVWAKFVSQYNDRSNSREDFLRYIDENQGMNRYFDENGDIIDTTPFVLSGLTFQQAADKIAKEKSREWQFLAHCAYELGKVWDEEQGCGVGGLDFLIYTMDIPDISKLNDGKVRVTIKSVRREGIIQTGIIKTIAVFNNETEIPPISNTEGKLWSEHWNFPQEELEERLNDKNNGESPMSAVRTYELPVAAGAANEFIVDDGYNKFKLIINVAESIKKGDADGDGEITASDARAVLRHVAKLETLTGEALKAADLNGDGNIDASIARKILRYVAKLEDNL
ncbi:MAG: dockerin type I repeat-containing protein [Oscillospiraceae bacterium]|nr:dockerin type I repeat-containing protein [Oscillospiraceae bacterium]